jgi:hypothetical protein
MLPINPVTGIPSTLDAWTGESALVPEQPKMFARIKSCQITCHEPGWLQGSTNAPCDIGVLAYALDNS